MPGGGNRRKNADVALLAALASGSTVPEAAAQAGIAVRTVYLRLEDPSFKAQVSQARAELLALAVEHLAEASTEAAKTLRELLSAESASVRLGAARSILELGSKLREDQEVEQRLAALEARAESSAPRKGVQAWRA